MRGKVPPQHTGPQQLLALHSSEGLNSSKLLTMHINSLEILYSLSPEFFSRQLYWRVVVVGFCFFFFKDQSWNILKINPWFLWASSSEKKEKALAAYKNNHFPFRYAFHWEPAFVMCLGLHARNRAFTWIYGSLRNLYLLHICRQLPKILGAYLH